MGLGVGEGLAQLAPRYIQKMSRIRIANVIKAVVAVLRHQLKVLHIPFMAFDLLVNVKLLLSQRQGRLAF